MAAEQEPGTLRDEIARLEQRVEKGEERRRALVHIMGDLNESNRRLADQIPLVLLMIVYTMIGLYLLVIA